MNADKGRRLLFTAARELRIEHTECPNPAEDEILVKAELSAISGGTEMLVWRGHIPPGMETDSTIPSLRRPFAYPSPYGYALVGTVIKAGDAAGEYLVGKKVFVFHPHESLFVARIDEVHPLPEGCAVEDAVFLAQMETALSIVQDAAALPGERVELFGLGIIGLLCAALLKSMELESLRLWDPSSSRRILGKELGFECRDPTGFVENIRREGAASHGDADCAIELSGNPLAFDQALHALGFGGRLILGSWYGSKHSSFDLGSWFHRSRITIVSSQVSTINPQLSGRWTKARRIEASWKLLQGIKPSRWISHRIVFDQAEKAYELLERGPEACLQVLLEY